MANFNPTIITDSGLSLIAKISSGSGQMSFTRICTSKSSYSVDEAQHLSALTTVEQETTIDKVEIINDTAVKVSAVITNKLLESGYYINAIGLYAEDPDLGEILYSITIAKVPDWMQPDSGSGVSSLLIQLITQVSNSSNVKTELNPSVLVTVQDLLDHTNNTTVHVTAEEKAGWNSKADGDDNYFLYTLDSGGNKHGHSHLLRAQFNVKNDGRFYIQDEDSHQVRVNYADIADTAKKIISDTGKASLFEDDEGGNLELLSPDGNHMMQMDLWNNNAFRIYFRDNGVLDVAPLIYDFTTKEFTMRGTASNADTLDGLHATAFYPAKGANTVGIDYDTLITTGLFEVNGTSTEPTAHSPNGNDSDNNFYVLVYRHSSDRCTQIAISTRTDKSVYIRARANSTWGEWTSFFISNNPHITGVTSTESTIHLKWLPVANATKYAVSKYNGTGTSYTVLANAITDTEYTITGLTSGTEYQFLVQAYINNAWSTAKTENHIIVRTTPVASTSSSGIVTTGTQRFGGTKVVTGNLYAQIPNYAVSDGTPSTEQIRYFKIIDKNDKTIADFLGRVGVNGASYGQIRAQAISDSSKIASISTCIDSNGGNVRHICSSPSYPYTTSLRQLASGTSDVNNDVCPTGAWYGKYE